MGNKQDLAKQNRIYLSREQRSKCQEWEEKIKIKQDAVVAVKHAWKKDNEVNKEIKDLRKQDQAECYKRGKLMQNMYK